MPINFGLTIINYNLEFFISFTKGLDLLDLQSKEEFIYRVIYVNKINQLVLSERLKNLNLLLIIYFCSIF